MEFKFKYFKLWKPWELKKPTTKPKQNKHVKTLEAR